MHKHPKHPWSSVLAVAAAALAAVVGERRAYGQYVHCDKPYGCICIVGQPGPGEDSGTYTCLVGDTVEPCLPTDPSLSDKNYSDPVHMGSGEFREAVVDLSIASRGFTIELRRSYRSQGGASRQQFNDFVGREGLGLFPFGCGWDHNHNVHLIRSKPSEPQCATEPFEQNASELSDRPIALWTGTGSPAWFKWNPSTGKFHCETLNATLELLFTPGCKETPIITFADGTMWTFHPYEYRTDEDFAGDPISWLDSKLQGRLQTVLSPTGNWINYSYDSLGRLETVADDAGRGLEFQYMAFPDYPFPSYLLERVASLTDSRQVEYTYAYQPGGGHHSSLEGVSAGLASAKLPGGTAGAPDQRTWSYTYQVNTDAIWQLLTITDPKGQLVLENEYSFNTTLGRWVVSQQQYGGLQYDYSWSLVAPNASPADNRIKATSINRAGQKKELIYDAVPDGTGYIAGRFVVVSQREYTGPVTDRGSGATGAKIRGGAGTGSSDPGFTAADPDYFETTHTYDTLHRLVTTRHPDGSGIRLTYESTSPLRRGNVIERRQMADVGGAPSAADIVEEWTYDLFSNAGCGCGYSKAATAKDPRGNVTAYGYDDYGNRDEVTHPPVSAGVYGGGSQNATEELLFGTGPGDPSGAWRNQIKSRTVSGSNAGSRVEAFTYYPAGHAMSGRLASKVESHGVLALTTTYEYDLAGNVTRIVDPRGNDRLFAYDLANNLILEQSETASNAGANNRHDTKHVYDKNNNRVRTDVEQLVGTATQWITTITDYDVLDRPVRVVREASSFALDIPDTVLSSGGLVAVSGFDPSAFAVAEYTYDANGNPTGIVEGVLGTSGGTPNQLTVTPVTSIVRSYDERNLLFRETVGLGADAVTTQFNYDLNGNLVARIEGWGLGASARRSDWVYDAYDRVVEVRDASSTDVTKRTRRILAYDKAGNVTSDEVFGLPDATAGTGASLRLSLATHGYDERNRRILTSAGVLDSSTGALIESINRRVFYYTDGSLQAVRDPRSTAAATATDAASDTVYTYDNAGRVLATLDPKGNLVTNGYDANGNRTSIVTTEKSDVSGEADQVFSVAYAFDALDRMTSVTDGVGNVTSYAYDARNNRVTETDPRNAVTTWTYDGLGRETSMSMPVGGSGTTIVTLKVWDAASRLIAQIDGNSNRTSYAYDSRNRLIATRNHDGTFDQVGSGMTWGTGTIPPTLTSFVSGYNAFGDTLRTTDARGNVVDSTYDKMGRLTARAVSTVGSGVSADTTWEAFRYDGMGRLIVSADNDSFNRFDYDSLSRLVFERSHWFSTPSSTPFTTDPAATNAEARTVDYLAYDKAGNLTQLLYPKNTWDTVTGAAYPLRRHLGYTYDSLGRTTSIVEMSDQTVSPLPVLTTFGYQGPSRERFRAHANGTRTDRVYSGFNTVSPNPPSNPACSFGFARTLQVAHSKAGSPAVNLATFDYTWDKTQNRASTAFSAQRTAGTYTDATAYGYDNAERLTTSARTGGNWAKSTTYTLDPVHNRIKTNEGGGDLTYWMNDAGAPSGEPQDRQVNQYTRTPLDQIAYDPSGNLHQIVLDCKCDIASSAGPGSTDRVVNSFDLSAFIGQMGTTNPVADFNGDGIVNSADLSYLLARFGRACDYETATWDYQNRLVSYVGTTTATSTNKTHVYKYDALGRRIAKTTDVGASFQRAERFVWGGQSAPGGWQMLARETTVSGMTAYSTFVYQTSAGYIDDVVAMRRDVDGPFIPAAGEVPASGTTAAIPYWYHADDMFTVAALTDAGGAVAERYHYDDYGSVRILDADFNLRTAGANGRIESAVGNPHGFTGREWDAESGLWQYRYRYMSPGMGRFVSRDPIGTWGDEWNDGNAVAYVSNNPTSDVDPFGEKRGKTREAKKKAEKKWKQNQKENRPRSRPKAHEKMLDKGKKIAKGIAKAAGVAKCLSDASDCMNAAEDEWNSCMDTAVGLTCPGDFDKYADQCDNIHAIDGATCAANLASCLSKLPLKFLHRVVFDTIEDGVRRGIRKIYEWF